MPADGKYTVYVRYPAVTGASTAAPYSVSTGGAPVSKPVNQTTGAGTWVSVGQYTFAEATTGSVSLTPATTGTVVADAVKVVRDNTGEADAEKKDFTYTYDTNGNLLQITDTQPGAKVSDYLVSYSGLNQVAKVEEKKGTALLKTTTYTYNENGAPVTRSFDDAANKDDQFSSYTYDVRDLVDEVKNGKSSTDTAPKIAGYTHTARGETDVETKANGNTVDSDYYLDGLVSSQIEKKSNGTLVSQHAMEYSPNGDRIKDTAKVQNADNHAAYLENVFAYTFDPLDRIAKVEKKDAAGATVLSTESYTHDPAGNVVAQTVAGQSTSYSYDRNRLLTATTGGSTASYTYDPFGRLSQVSAGGKVIERNTYDGYDRIIKHRQLQDDGTTKTTDTSFDALDRTSSKVEGTKTTNYSYLGLSGEVLSEEVAGQVTASYQYSPWGSRLSQVKFKTDGTTEDSYYGYNPHSDVETLTSEGGDTRSTYGYTAYGKNDDDRFTGADKPEAQNPGKEPYNVYRFNAKRWDQSSESYDMGFRDYSPGLNRFLTRDAYNGATADLNLGPDPWTSNRYAFAGGNPITGIELDGHCFVAEDESRCGMEAHRTAGSGSTATTGQTSQTEPDQSPADWLQDHPDSGGDIDINREAFGNVLKDIGWMGLGAVVAAAGGSLTGGGVTVCGTGLLCPAGAVAVVGGVAISAAGTAVASTGASRFGNDWGRLFNETSGSASSGASIDPSIGSIRPSEQATVGRLAGRSEYSGRTFSASPHEGADFLDDLGRTYDAMGDGTKAVYFKETDFLRSIDHHLRKGNDFTVIDMTGYAPPQVELVSNYVTDFRRRSSSK
ncbi:RHS repeat-associated protein [Kribbella sp. VKM Ac-2568]|nr:RHS repeat-associated protein [Kribbella sp. VKM Ac-2568]